MSKCYIYENRIMKLFILLVLIFTTKSVFAFNPDCEKIDNYNVRRACDGDCSQLPDNLRRVCDSGDCSQLPYDARRACDSCPDKKMWIIFYMSGYMFSCR